MKFTLRLQIVSIGLMLGSLAHAAPTDISTTPLASSSISVVKPNVMFILDDSGSMAWDYLPDAANFSSGTYGEKSSHCNGMYFNPNITYKPPVNADGTSFPNANFTSAVPDGYKAATSGNQGSNNPVSLNNSVYYVYTGSAKDLDFTYTNSQVSTSTTFYKECNSDVGHSPGNGKFTKVTLTTSSAAALKTNFANWYSYYRTRILAMKTAAGLAFQSIGDNYRVGYTTHSYTGTSSSSTEFQKIGDFVYTADGTGQKNIWYSKVYGASASGGTPLRSALSKVGRMYAGKLLTGSDDPVQYSCQQNFAILATDGYWNGDAGYKVDGSTLVGDQDGASGVKPPYQDSLKIKDTLADVAYYYYNTDLRPSGSTGALGTDVSENNVPGSGNDTLTSQHMTTFTLGLGVKGTLTFPDAYNGILQGTTPWPKPVADTQTAIDDLWHAAVNGRGSYFSAQDPSSLVSGLQNALAGVSARTGAAAAAATSNLQPVAGDNYLFLALYRTVKWDGDLQAKTIDPTTGVISGTIWSAQAQLDTKVSAASDTRTIYTFDKGTSTQLKSLTWANLTSGEQAYFQKTCTNSLLSQCPDLTTAQQTAVDGGQSLLAFIRGQTGNEDQTGNTDRLYRDRDHVLGDIVNAQPVYVKASTFSYLDANYATFASTVEKNRRPVVYVAANDGMLHAFDASTGTSAGAELWAYVPPMVLPKLYKLADKNYASKHEYYVDGSPSVGDICPKAPSATCSASEWKTILVGGLNAGGKGYYALDITDPVNPKALWNYTVDDDQDMGLSYGNPVITKRKDGTWVVVLTSGYNNTGGDGKGHLYVLNANTGQRLLKLDTTAGSSSSPSGLAKIAGWVDVPATDNTSKRFYGGDLLGNVWRFDIDDRIAPSGNEATLLAELGNVAPTGLQSVTVKPLLSEINAGGAFYPIVVIGTGRYLGDTDRADTSIQSIYALEDTLAATGLGKVRSLPNIVKQTLTTSSDLSTRTTSSNPVDWSTQIGWYLDLNPNNESPGERVNVEMQQQQGLITVVGNVPEQNACTIGGYAWLYFLDYRTGQFSPNANDQVAGVRLSNNALVAGINTIKLQNGKTITIVTDTSGTVGPGVPNPPPPGDNGGEPRRVSWQELSTD